MSDIKEISFYDGDGNIKKFNLECGEKWSDAKVENEHLKSIFDKLDDGDGIISETELDTLVLQLGDKKIRNNSELTNLSNKSKEYWNSQKENVDVRIFLE